MSSSPYLSNDLPSLCVQKQLIRKPAMTAFPPGLLASYPSPLLSPFARCHGSFPFQLRGFSHPLEKLHEFSSLPAAGPPPPLLNSPALSWKGDPCVPGEFGNAELQRVWASKYFSRQNFAVGSCSHPCSPPPPFLFCSLELSKQQKAEHLCCKGECLTFSFNWIFLKIRPLL